MSKQRNIFTADFETTANEMDFVNKNTRVWLWDICSLNEFNHYTGYKIEEFFEFLEVLSPCIIYFHNLKFDGNFILYYLLNNGYTYTDDKKLNNMEFSALISEQKVFYTIKVCLKTNKNKKKKIVEFRDSAKKLSGTVDYIAKSHKLDVLKGKIDYKKFRGNDYKVTKKEIDYIKNDTEIIAKALKTQYDNGYDRLTSGSDTFNTFKKQFGIYYNVFFPNVTIEIDDYIRNSYRGGVTMCGYNYKGMEINDKVYVYDVISMYPYQMCTQFLPYGEPKFFTGQYEFDKINPLYIARIKVDLRLKNGMYPTILLNKNRWIREGYLIDTNLEMKELTLTCVDIELMFKHYDVFDIEYIDGYKFKQSNKIFDSYIHPLFELKNNSAGSLRELYKLMMNGLYGKFAKNPRNMKRIPFLNDDNCVGYKMGEKTIDKPVYTAVSCFITAYARKTLFEAINNNLDNFVYCDTDSLHLTSEGKGIFIDKKELGAFKLEKVYIRSKYLGQKCYYGENAKKSFWIGCKKHRLFLSNYKYKCKFYGHILGGIDLKIAGAPEQIKRLIRLNNFKIGNTFFGKLTPKAVKGGIILVEGEYTIKDRG